MSNVSKVKAGLMQCLIPGNLPEHDEQCADCPYRDEKKCQEHLRKDAQELLYNSVAVVRCQSCKHWDKKSGLTARECLKHGRITTRYMYCSDGEVSGDA